MVSSHKILDLASTTGSISFVSIFGFTATFVLCIAFFLFSPKSNQSKFLSSKLDAAILWLCWFTLSLESLYGTHFQCYVSVPVWQVQIGPFFIKVKKNKFIYV